MKCDYCGNNIDSTKYRIYTGGRFNILRETLPLPFECQRCGGSFCSKHRLPENHTCPSLYPQTFNAGKIDDERFNEPIINTDSSKIINGNQITNTNSEIAKRGEHENYEKISDVEKVDEKTNYTCQLCLISFEGLPQKCQHCGLILCKDHLNDHLCPHSNVIKIQNKSRKVERFYNWNQSIKKLFYSPYAKSIFAVIALFIIFGIIFHLFGNSLEFNSNLMNISEPNIEEFLINDQTNNQKLETKSMYAKLLYENASDYNFTLGGAILHAGSNNFRESTRFVLNYYICGDSFIIINPQTDKTYNLSNFANSSDFPETYRYVTLFPDVLRIPDYKLTKETRDFDRQNPISDIELIKKVNFIYKYEAPEETLLEDIQLEGTQSDSGYLDLFQNGIINFVEQSFLKFKAISFKNVGDSLSESFVSEPEPINYKTKDIEKYILYYTNVRREERGLKELKLDEELAVIAREHSLDMVMNDFFDHTNLKGEDPTDRAIKHQYPVRKNLGGGTYSIGIAENIGQMPTGNVQGIGYVYSDADSIAKAHVDSWMESPGHRGNILNNEYDVIGVGVAYDGVYYTATQNFK